MNGTNSIGLPRMCAPPPPNAPVSSLHLFRAFLVLDNSFYSINRVCYFDVLLRILLLYCTFVKHCRRRRRRGRVEADVAVVVVVVQVEVVMVVVQFVVVVVIVGVVVVVVVVVE